MNNMRELRKQKKMTMKELGRAVGVSESTISLYETGKHEPDIMTMTRIADVLDVTLDQLLGRAPGEDADMTLDTEAWLIRDRIRRDPTYRLLFETANKASAEHIRAAAEMLKALGPKDDDND